MNRQDCDFLYGFLDLLWALKLWRLNHGEVRAGGGGGGGGREVGLNVIVDRTRWV